MSLYPNNADFSTFDERGRPRMDPNWTPISGPRGVVQRVLRRWWSSPGSHDNVDFGYPFFSYLNATLLPAEVAAIASGMRMQALMEEGLENVSIQVTLTKKGILFVSSRFYFKDSPEWQTVFVLTPGLLPRITSLGPVGG